MANYTAETSPLIYARVAGLLYLVIIVCAGFSEGYIRSNLIIPGDASATANNIVASQWLFRVGIVGDLIAFLSDLVVSVLFYLLLKPVNKTLALVAATLRLVAHPAIASVNLLNLYIALQLSNGANYLTVFDTEQLHALVMVFLNAHTYGYLIAGAFFGLHCFILGYLFFKSELFPRFLGVFLAAASFGYLIDSFGNFLFPEYAAIFTWIVAVPAVVAELSLCLWLLIKGVQFQRAQ